MRAKAEKHERAVQYFKHHGISASPEDYIIEGSFRSGRIKRLVVGDKETGPTTELLFQFTQQQ